MRRIYGMKVMHITTSEQRKKPASGHNKDKSDTVGGAELLQLRSGGESLYGTGWLASAETALYSMAAVEANLRPSKEPD